MLIAAVFGVSCDQCIEEKKKKETNYCSANTNERKKKTQYTKYKTTSDDSSNQSIDLWLSFRVGLVYYCFKWFPSLIDCQWSYYWYYKCKKVKKTKLQWKKKSYVFFEQHQMSKLTILILCQKQKKNGVIKKIFHGCVFVNKFRIKKQQQYYWLMIFELCN